ncbi:MAG: hypothetical protein KDA45_10415 [Planctomycetales bacterium]|nr:hypothetical protein [Planctomycetales bacterium]
MIYPENELLDERQQANSPPAKAGGPSGGGEQRARLQRLLFLAYSEQILTRADLLQLLKRLEREPQTAGLQDELQRRNVLQQLDECLTRYRQDWQALHEGQAGRGTAKGGSSALPSASSLAAPSAQPLGELANESWETPPPPVQPVAEVDYASDLKVSYWPKLLWSLGALALLGLLGLVISAALSVSHPLWEKPTSSSGVAPSPDLGDNIPRGLEASKELSERTPTPISSSWQSKVTDLAAAERWSEAQEFLQGVAGRDDLGEEERADCSMQLLAVKIGLPRAGSEKQGELGSAFLEILQPACLASPQWPLLYAAALMQVGQTSRLAAIARLEELIDKELAEDSEQLLLARRALDWTRARAEGASADLPELSRRIADFQLEGLDHLFLAFAYFDRKAAGGSQAKRVEEQLSNARQGIERLSGSAPALHKPVWVFERVHEQLLDDVRRVSSSMLKT